MSEEKLVAFGYQKSAEGDDGGGAVWDDKAVVTLEKGVLSINKYASRDSWDAESYYRYLDTGKVVGKDGFVARMTNPLDIPVCDLGEIKFDMSETGETRSQIIFKYRKKGIWTYLMNIFPEKVGFDEGQKDAFIKIYESLVQNKGQMDGVSGDSRSAVKQSRSNDNIIQRPGNGIKFCSNCGARVTEGSNFCSQCGNRLV